MNTLVFENQIPPIASDPNRADIACFAGFVSRRTVNSKPDAPKTSLPSGIAQWLKQQGWDTPPYARLPIADLLDLPVLIGSWEVFDQLFAWEQRPFDQQEQNGTTYLGAAVRSFFAQGGRRCYVVRVGDPWQFGAKRDDRLSQLKKLIPGYPSSITCSAADQQTWRGVGHLFGLPDVSFLCLPDLADAVAAERSKPESPILPPPPPEQFVECSDPVPGSIDRGARLFQAPRCDLAGYDAWALALSLTADLLSRQRREVQLVSAVPLPLPGSDAADAERDLLALLTRPGRSFVPLAGGPSQPFVPPLALPLAQPKGLASAFVQLAYPWLQTPGSANLPEQLESPDAVLTGILARNALLQGAFRSAANLHLADVQRVYPVLTSDQWQPHPDSAAANATEHSLLQRVSVFGPTPDGLRLLSDVTTSLSESYRPASVNRLVAVILRAARRLGEAVVFESSGEQLWRRLRNSLTQLMTSLLQLGALRDTVAVPFRVTCDRQTITQDDIDSGRVVAYIEFAAAVPIERITVVLAMSDGGQVSLLRTAAAQEAA